MLTSAIGTSPHFRRPLIWLLVGFSFVLLWAVIVYAHAVVSILTAVTITDKPVATIATVAHTPEDVEKQPTGSGPSSIRENSKKTSLEV